MAWIVSFVVAIAQSRRILQRIQSVHGQGMMIAQRGDRVHIEAVQQRRARLRRMKLAVASQIGIQNREMVASGGRFLVVLDVRIEGGFVVNVTGGNNNVLLFRWWCGSVISPIIRMAGGSGCGCCRRRRSGTEITSRRPGPGTSSCCPSTTRCRGEGSSRRLSWLGQKRRDSIGIGMGGGGSAEWVEAALCLLRLETKGPTKTGWKPASRRRTTVRGNYRRRHS